MLQPCSSQNVSGHCLYSHAGLLLVKQALLGQLGHKAQAYTLSVSAIQYLYSRAGDRS